MLQSSTLSHSKQDDGERGGKDVNPEKQERGNWAKGGECVIFIIVITIIITIIIIVLTFVAIQVNFLQLVMEQIMRKRLNVAFSSFKFLQTR